LQTVVETEINLRHMMAVYFW